MHIKFLVPLLLLGTLVLPSQKKHPKTEFSPTPFYVGTYTRGDSKGIYKYTMDSDGKLSSLGLVAEETNPSYLAKSKDGDFLLAVNETRDDSGGGGTLVAYKIIGDSLQFIDRKPSGGASPCYVSMDENGNVLTANYNSGTVALFNLSATDGLDGPLDIDQHTGQGISPRQKGPHAHMAIFEPGSDHIVSVDLGTNDLWFYELDKSNSKLVRANPEKLALPEGVGPRHLVYHPNNQWAYVANELASSVTQLYFEGPGSYKIASAVSTMPANYSGENNCADIHVSKDGKFLYASNRGHNSIAIYRIDPQNGSLEIVDHASVEGDWPRNFTLSPDDGFLLVANQRSNSIVSFKRDKEKGTLEPVDQIEAPSPVCLLF